MTNAELLRKVRFRLLTRLHGRQNMNGCSASAHTANGNIDGIGVGLLGAGRVLAYETAIGDVCSILDDIEREFP